MNLSVEIDAASADDYIIAGSRTEKLCLPGQEWKIDLDFDCPLGIVPWDPIVIWEEGTRVLTGYVSSVSKIWGTEPATVVLGVDTWKRATDCWNTTEYVTSPSDTACSLIRRFLDIAGCSYTIDTNYDISVPEGLVISYQPISEIVTQLCSALNFYIRVNADGWIIIGDVVQDRELGPDLTIGDNIITFDMVESDYRARNKIVVWGPTGTAMVRTDEDWAVVDHTLVYASPFCYDANGLAQAIWANLHEVERVITVESPGDASRRVGQYVDIDAPDDLFTGMEMCTTIKSRTDDQGYRMDSIFGERCAVYGSGPGWTDGRDIIVATHECGVWRCYDIWEDTPRWYPLNIGLQTSHVWRTVDWGSAFNCEWFIRDPFIHNSMAFLLTQVGIYQTMSLEPGYENWTLQQFNPMVSAYYGSPLQGDGGPSDPYWHIAKLRSTIARQGAYYIVVQAPYLGKCYVGLTNDHFNTIHGGPDAYGNYGTMPPPVQCTGNTPATLSCYDMRHSGLWGDECNWGYQVTAAIGTWHSQSGGYTGGDGRGGLAAWHRNDLGCTVTGLSSIGASNACVHRWHCTRGGEGASSDPNSPIYSDNMITTPSFENVANWWWCGHCDYGPTCGPLSDPWGLKVPTSGDSGLFEYNGYVPTRWLLVPSLHIPYNQVYAENGRPMVEYIHPARFDGDPYQITSMLPAKVTGGEPDYFVPPWGGDPSLASVMQGSIGTYTPNANYVYMFSNGAPCRFAVSEDGSATWEERESIPFTTACYSGFPRSEQKVYAGRHAKWDPSSDTDRALLYVSWDRGESWHDVTGDLWEKTQALGLRVDGGGNPLGASGLVTIAPRY